MSDQIPKGQTWGKLKKAWKHYRIAKKYDNKAEMLESAKEIQQLQRGLGIPEFPFPIIKLHVEADGHV